MNKTAAIRSQARRAVLEKAAEERAFAAGFCKAADAMGVDPEALYKQAQIKNRVAGWLGRIGRFFGRGRPQTAQQALGGYTAGIRAGMVPTNEQAAKTLDSVLNEYFGGNVPKGLRQSLLEPLSFK